MPEFILDHGSPCAARLFNSLTEFERGYITAIFFTETGDDGELRHATFAELAPETLTQIRADCTRFIERAGADLDEACDNGRINGYDMERAGVDFWFTRNGHGAGFWDRDLGDIGEKLTALARTFGERDVYMGDDDLVYIS